MRFKNREEAGEKLAAKLGEYVGEESLVYALPRGGVPLGAIIAKKLKCPQDLVITRKIGHPYNPEYAICAVTEDGGLVCNEAERSQVDEGWFAQQVKSGVAEAKRRRQVYLGRASLSAKGKIAILVDDGIATGLTMLAAINQLKAQKAKRIIVAVPVVPKETASQLELAGAEVTALDVTPSFLGAVGAYYDEFNQVSDQEVIKLLKLTS